MDKKEQGSGSSCVCTCTMQSSGGLKINQTILLGLSPSRDLTDILVLHVDST